MKHFVLAGLLCMCINLLFSQSVQGHYEGALSRDGSVQLIKMDVHGNSITYDIPEIGYYDVKPDTFFWKHDTLNIRFYYGNFFCFYNSETNELTGITEKWNPKIRLHLKPAPYRPDPFEKQEVHFVNGETHLSGLLFKPMKTNRPLPYVVLIHGSGDQDRNTPYYHSIAHQLASNGVGVLIYDKRGCGASSGSWEASSLFDLADDAIAGMKYLQSRKDLHLGSAGFLGSSQGGWVAVIAAKKSHASFLVLNVGPSVSLFEQDLHRIEYTMRDDGMEQTKIDSALAYSKLYFNYVNSNTPDDFVRVDSYRKNIQNRDWAQYVNLPASPADADILWWRKNKFDPSAYLSSLKCPVLSLFGEKDLLVPPGENAVKMDSLLNKAAVKHKVIVIKSCAHDMLSFQGLKGGDWKWPLNYWEWRKQPEEFMKWITEWIKERSLISSVR